MCMSCTKLSGKNGYVWLVCACHVCISNHILIGRGLSEDHSDYIQYETAQKNSHFYFIFYRKYYLRKNATKHIFRRII